MKTLVLCLLGVILSTVQVSDGLQGSEFLFVAQVVANDKEVLLLIDNTWLKTEGFQVLDSEASVLMNGEWMTITDMVASNEFQASWKCTKCKRSNMDGVNTCPYCGKPRYPS